MFLDLRAITGDGGGAGGVGTTCERVNRGRTAAMADAWKELKRSIKMHAVVGYVEDGGGQGSK